tara:strand:+ start:35828 stop:36298 length:471 start_codon:yes stop_codon:yes gene_type:complete
MKKVLYAFMLASLTSITVPSLAQAASSKSGAAAIAITETDPDKVSPSLASANEESISEANLRGSNATDFNCELGNKITTYINPEDKKHLAIRWKNKLHRLHRVDTSTGANRFENNKYGLVWIDIPAKAMLLDSNKGQQLANECRDPEQAKLFASKK